MAVVATAGHVDHGKSTLVRALTGTDPDRLAEERRRGLTIELGYAWTELPGAGRVAFVDVPGHERFLATMLAGVGPVPAVLLVVAADEGWRRQTAEHVAALDALGVRHGLLAVTRSDLADPEQTIRDSAARLAGTSLAGIPAVAVSAISGAGIPALRTALAALVRSLPPPPAVRRVRVFVDRVFTIRGAGTVVTATLPAGTLTIGDVLQLGPDAGRTSVRGLESCQQQLPAVDAVARVAVNLRGTGREALRRGDPLVTPDAWHFTSQADVALRVVGHPGDPAAGPTAGRLPAQLALHVGSASRPVHVRVLAGPAGRFARVRFERPLPLQPGDVGVLRDPGRHAVVAAVTVLDVDPPPLAVRGSARHRAAELAPVEPGDLVTTLRHRHLITRDDLAQRGVTIAGNLPAGVTVIGSWLADTAWWHRAAGTLRDRVAGTIADPTAAGLPEQAAAAEVGVGHPDLLDPLAAAAGVVRRSGRLVAPGDTGPRVPERLQPALETLRQRLGRDAFAAPDAQALVELRLDGAALGALAAAGAVLRLPGDIVLLPDAIARAAAVLRGLDQPFTLSAARQALGTSRRVAVPLLEHLDRGGVSVRTDGTMRRMR